MGRFLAVFGGTEEAHTKCTKGHKEACWGNIADKAPLLVTGEANPVGRVSHVMAKDVEYFCEPPCFLFCAFVPLCEAPLHRALAFVIPQQPPAFC